MKIKFTLTALVLLNMVSLGLFAQSDNKASTQNLYIDVHHLGPGKVTYAAVAAAHQKDLATEKKYNVEFIKFWVDELNGNVYCLSSSRDTASIIKTHKEAHGLLPDQIFMVKPGMESAVIAGKPFFLDVHHLGAGK